MQEEFKVRRGEIAELDKVDGNLKIGNKATIGAANGKLVTISGEAFFEGNCEINCSFECDSLRVGHGGTLRVNGDLVVHKILDVIHSIDSKGNIKAGQIDVGGRASASKSIECDGTTRVGGRLYAKEGLRSTSLEVGGRVTIEGPVSVLEDFDVGGLAEIGGGTVSGKIRVGGKFESSSQLSFGDMQVVGQLFLAASSKGTRISAFGKLAAEGGLEVEELELRGQAEVVGNCKVGRKLESSGKLKATTLESDGEVESWGQTEIEEEFKSVDLKIAGKFAARKIEVSNDIDLAGYAETKLGMIGNSIQVRSGSKYLGVIVGNKVDIGRSYDVVTNWSAKFAGQSAVFRLIGKETKVGDVYAKQVHLGKAARCGKVYADVVEFEEGCIAEEITYTKEVRGPIERVFLSRPFPRKVATLPTPPLL
jgi:hypothetical protein